MAEKDNKNSEIQKSLSKSASDLKPELAAEIEEILRARKDSLVRPE